MLFRSLSSSNSQPDLPPYQNVSVTSHNSLTLLFEGMNWERLRHVSVDREGEHIYALRPKIDKVTHRLLCEVKLVENVKVVTFRSTFQIENRSLVTAEMVIVDANGKRASQIYRIRKSLLYSLLGGCFADLIMSSAWRGLRRPDHCRLRQPNQAATRSQVASTRVSRRLLIPTISLQLGLVTPGPPRAFTGKISSSGPLARSSASPRRRPPSVSRPTPCTTSLILSFGEF